MGSASPRLLVASRRALPRRFAEEIVNDITSHNTLSPRGCFVNNLYPSRVSEVILLYILEDNSFYKVERLIENMTDELEGILSKIENSKREIDEYVNKGDCVNAIKEMSKVIGYQTETILYLQR
ncbi:MAG: hypothetical protein V1788_00650 [Nanoarchaeota archaeon]